MRKILLLILSAVSLLLVSCIGGGDCFPFKKPSVGSKEPILSVSSDRLEFQNLKLSTSKSLPLLISNIGEEKLEGLTIAPLTGEFTISSNTCTPDLDANSGCSLIVTFTPVSIGDKSDTLRITSTNAAPKDILLTGAGKNSVLDIDKTFLYFGNVSKTDTKSLTVTLAQSGNAEIEDLKLTPLTDEYSISATTCGSSLAIYASCSVTVTFTPTKSVYTPTKLYISSSNAGDYEIKLAANRIINIGFENMMTYFDEGLYAWGANDRGQLGVGDITNKSKPTKVLVPAGVEFVDIYFQDTYAIAKGSDNNYYSWGWNDSGQLGVGDDDNKHEPTKVLMPAGVAIIDIYINQNTIIARASDGKFYVWGDNFHGQLGIGSTDKKNKPELLPYPSGVVTFTEIYFDGVSVIAKGSDDKYYAWGYNISGILGVGDNTNRSSPTEINKPAGAAVSFNYTQIYIEGENNFVLAKGNDGKLYSWGDNGYGQLGIGSTFDQNTPVEVLLPDSVATIDYTDFYIYGGAVIAKAADGEYYAWGENYYGQLGASDPSVAVVKPKKIIMPAGVTISKIYVYFTNSFAFGSDGKLYGWGRNDRGELGVNDNVNRRFPVLIQVPVGVTFSDIYQRHGATLARGSDGDFYSWGLNTDGQLGLGDNFARLIPTKITNPPGVKFLDLYGSSASFTALGDDWNYYSWGYNVAGQLGVGDTVGKNKPTRAVPPSGSVTP